MGMGRVEINLKKFFKNYNYFFGKKNGLSLFSEEALIVLKLL
jgi:hypothetical protein